MNPRIRILFLLCASVSLWLAPPANAVSVSERAGTSTAQYLKLEMGARHAAMGGTYAGYGTDVFTLWGQPAALAAAPDAWQVGFQHTEWFQGVTQEYLGVTGPIGDRSRVGLVVNTVGVDDLLRTTENASGQLSAVGGTFQSRDLGISAHYGLKLSEYLSFGGAVRYLQGEIDDVKATGFAADLGVRYQVRAIEGLVVGASVTNVGTGLKYIRERNDLPTAFRAGAAWWPILGRGRSRPLIIAADVVKYLDREIDAGVGVEWRPIEFLRLRGGYRTQGRDVGEGLTAGIGFNFAGLEVDYAYVPFGPLGESHRVSAGYLFGGGREDRYESRASSNPQTPAPSSASPAPVIEATSPTPAPAAAPVPLRRNL